MTISTEAPPDVRFYCPLRVTSYVISGKYKPAILYYLRDGKLRFSELHRTIGTITQKILTQQLRALEKYELISRKVYAVVPPKVEYSLTKHGRKLLPILEMMIEWGNTFRDETGILADF